ncbi:transposase [Enterococcus durans]|uniref:transposase n=1 Tax=Enterococcus durans TaxID=53345 RepID=UPI0030C86FAC
MWLSPRSISISPLQPSLATLRTFKKFLPQIQNALHYSYSNGPLECLNNHIKVLKRNAYGFRSFYNFKLRIMIRHGKTFLTK